MSKGLRVLLHALQALTVLGALLCLASATLLSLAEIDLLGLDEGTDLTAYAIAFGVLSVALSPALWSLHRGGSTGAAASSGFERAGDRPQTALQPPAGDFEPINPDRAPAPPASSYGQPSGPGFGAQPSGGAPPSSPPQHESPWGNGR
ncbi:MAG TPA: hypothetical protein VKZ65_02435 [Glycomyces sp.]|nr:hypothetical protein [Glycomyces sp.]